MSSLTEDLGWWREERRELEPELSQELSHNSPWEWASNSDCEDDIPWLVMISNDYSVLMMYPVLL